MATLESNFLGFKLRNPFILSSAPPVTTIEMIERAFELGWAGAVTKTIPLEKIYVKNVNPRLTSLSFPTFEEDSKKIYGFANIELVSHKNASYWMPGISKLKAKFPDRLIYASIMADGSAKNDWIELAKRSEDAGADGIEMNFSCPHGGMPPHAVGAAIGQDPKIAKRITEWVTQAVKIPVIAKLTAAVSDIEEIARIVKDAGVKGFTTTNTFPVIMGVDLSTFSPLPSVMGKSAPNGGLSGKALKPIALFATSKVSPLGLPVSGCGGISTWQDAAEFILLGASSLQVCSAVMCEGYEIITDLCDGLQGFLEERGVDSIADIRGKALENITSLEKLDRKIKKISSIDLVSCTKCGRCYNSCKDSGYQAISEKEDRTPVVDPDKCDGCGLCLQICPVWDCVSMKEANV